MYITAVLMFFISILPMLLGYMTFRTLDKSKLSLGFLWFMLLIGVWQMDVAFLFMGTVLSKEVVEWSFRILRFGQIFLIPTFFYIFYAFSTESDSKIRFIRKRYLVFMYAWGTLTYILNLTNLGVTGMEKGEMGLYYPMYGVGNITYTIHLIAGVIIILVSWKGVYYKEHDSVIKGFMIKFIYYTCFLMGMGALNFIRDMHLLCGTLAIIIFSTLLMFSILNYNFDEINRLNKKVERSSKPAYANGLLASMIHELRNPLGAMKGYAEILPSRQKLNKDGEFILSQINLASDHMTQIVGGFVDFIKSGNLTFVQYDVGVCIDEAISLLNTRLKQNNVRVNIYMDKRYLRSYLDQSKLRQVFINLIGNSIDAFEPESVFKQIDITLMQNADDEIIVDIKDTGKGMSKHIKQNLFTATKTDKENGMGLGLVISKNIVMAHGGTLDLVSSDTNGTHFRVTLPKLYNDKGLHRKEQF